ncbi:phosphate uptake regulator PhoU [archaeon]|nr:phosphate uptake regulator PhoU [archaeon]
MKRKVNRVGQSTLTVSLPSKWARKHGVKAGDEIDVDEVANRLVVSGGLAPQKEKEATIEITQKERFLRILLVAPYIKGCDVIHVQYEDPAIYPLIQQAMSQLLIGFEVVEHGRNKCILKNIAQGIDAQFDSNQRRYFLQIKQVIHGLIEAIEKKDTQQIEHILIIDQTIDKLCLFMRRILNTKGYKDESKDKYLYYLDNLLETISDCCRNICLRIKATGKFPSKNFLDLLKSTAKSFDLYYDLFYKPDSTKLFDLYAMNKTLSKRMIAALENLVDDNYLCYNLMHIIEIEHNLIEELE